MVIVVVDKVEEFEEKYWDNPLTNEYIEGILIDKLSEVGKFSSKLYKVSDADEKVVWVVWGCYRLDELMKKVHIGDCVRIVFKGMVDTRSGNKMKDFSVEVLND